MDEQWPKISSTINYVTNPKLLEKEKKWRTTILWSCGELRTSGDARIREGLRGMVGDGVAGLRVRMSKGERLRVTELVWVRGWESVKEVKGG